MKIPSVFLLIIGCVWALFVVWMFLTLAGIAESAWSLSGVLYWVAMLIGPVLLVVGSCLAILGGSRRFATLLVGIGCLILTGFAVYESVVAMQLKPLQAPPLYSFYVVMLIITLFADVAGFRVIRRLLS
jgi:hypothetical protein